MQGGQTTGRGWWALLGSNQIPTLPRAARDTVAAQINQSLNRGSTASFVVRSRAEVGGEEWRSSASADFTEALDVIYPPPIQMC